MLQLSDSNFGAFAQVRDGYRNAEADSKVLAGTQLNDEDDARTTLESLKSSETIKNQKMGTPEMREAFFQTTGSQYFNVLAENKRISTKDLDDAMLDHDEEALIKKQK